VTPSPEAPALRFVSMAPGTRILDTRLPEGGGAPIAAGRSRDVATGVPGSATRRCSSTSRTSPGSGRLPHRVGSRLAEAADRERQRESR
jgi:hypothetical protein